MYLEPKRYFKRFLLLTLFTFIVIVIAVGLSAAGEVGMWIGLVLVIGNLFMLVAMTTISIAHFIKYLFDKSKHENFVMHLINMIFSLFITLVFLTFYLTILIGAFTILAPLL